MTTEADAKAKQLFSDAFKSLATQGDDKRKHEDRDLNFDVSMDEALWMQTILRRVQETAREDGVLVDIRMMALDLLVVHNHCGGLKLAQLAMSDRPDFVNDMVGIAINLDRRAGALLNGWAPIFTAGKRADLN